MKIENDKQYQNALIDVLSMIDQGIDPERIDDLNKAITEYEKASSRALIVWNWFHGIAIEGKIEEPSVEEKMNYLMWQLRTPRDYKGVFRKFIIVEKIEDTPEAK